MRLTTRALTTKGTWPGPLTLRRGWARADARPWNDAFVDAHLRLVRGGAGFISDSARRLLDLGAPSVFSPPLPESSQRPWRSAGFTNHTELHLLRLALEPPPAPPTHLVVSGTDADLPEVLRIDHLAFAPFWRLDERGLVEAIDATPRAELLVINNADGGLCGFAIVGLGSALSYLQRFAVGPEPSIEAFLAALPGVLVRSGGAAPAELVFDRRAHTLTLAEGDYHLTGDFVPPAGYGLTIDAGVSLLIDPGRSLLIRGPAPGSRNRTEAGARTRREACAAVGCAGGSGARAERSRGPPTA